MVKKGKKRQTKKARKLGSTHAAGFYCCLQAIKIKPECASCPDLGPFTPVATPGPAKMRVETFLIV
jgi:hypothetical protein